MYVFRNIKLGVVIRLASLNLLIFTVWSTIAFFIIHSLGHMGINVHMPFLPMSTIGIAVAFYVGFKNNASYDRFWEARKIWGGVVNYSRTWGNQILSYVTNHRASSKYSPEELKEIHRTLIYRHIGYINAMRLTLRKPNPYRQKMSKAVKKQFEFDAPEDNHWKEQVYGFLPKEEGKELYKVANKPTQIIRKQGEELRKLMEEDGLIEDFRHMNLMSTLEEFYNLQGKCERIKNTPFPRQYGYFSKVFTWIFIILLPFGMMGEFAKMGHAYEWLAIPFCVLISWIFITMEIIGDNSEDPFENFVNDVPMTALCRTIEIDLREMLGETELPPKIQAVDGILM